MKVYPRMAVRKVEHRWFVFWVFSTDKGPHHEVYTRCATWEAAYYRACMAVEWALKRNAGSR